MLKIRQFFRSLFDIRPDEYWRVTFMGLYLLFVLFAYYILKVVSQAMFLDNMDIDKLPVLQILIAIMGGLLAYTYTRVAVNTSLNRAVNGATAILVACLVGFWWGFRVSQDRTMLLWVFNVWVSLFSITLVSQGWLVAANIFSPREAKRVYGVLGLGAVLGAAFGGQFAAIVVYYIGNSNLLLASAVMVALAYACYRAIQWRHGEELSRAKAASEEEVEDFAFRDIVNGIARTRHLQVIIAIVAITYMVDVMINYQFSAIAKARYSGRDLTAFLGNFYGLWLNITTFVFQGLLTAFIVSRFGVGGTLQVMPVTIGIAALGTLFVPTIWLAGAARLSEAATRYSFNRTGMELLFLPLPTDLRNRTKPFVDIFVDRGGRGIGGGILILLTQVLSLSVAQISIPIIVLAVVWIGLSVVAKREYVSTVRKRLDARRLDLRDARVSVTDAATVRLLEETATAGTPRQAAYALSLLAESPNYKLGPLATRLIDHPAPEVRAKVYELAAAARLPGFQEKAMGEVRRARPGIQSPVIEQAVRYALALSPEPLSLAKRLLEHDNHLVIEGTIEGLSANPDAVRDLLSRQWLQETARHADPQRRRVAATAIRVRTDEGTEVLHKLLEDPDPAVVSEAIRTAGSLQNRAYVDALISHLKDARVRGDAVRALAAFGPRVIGTLADVLEDEGAPAAVRRQVPRVLQRIPHQRAVDALAHALANPDLTLRASLLRGLNSLRESTPQLDFGVNSVQQHILDESRYYYEMAASLAPLREQAKSQTAARLLVATLEERLKRSLERLFRLLGLRYPPKEIYATYLALNRGSKEEHTAALEFLDNLVERELKRYLLPLLDEEAHVIRSGEELFDVAPRDVTTALRSLIQSGDPWLASCAIATAAEMRIHALADDIRQMSTRSGTEVAPVAAAAAEALA